MKKAITVVAALALTLTAFGVTMAGALPNSATAPLIMNSSGYALFSSTTASAATTCTGEDGQTYATSGGAVPTVQYGSLTDGNQLTAQVYGGVNRPNDVEPSTFTGPGMNFTTSATSGASNKPGFQIKANFTFNQADGRGTGKGTITIYPAAPGKTSGHPKYKASGGAQFVLQILGQTGTTVTFEGRGSFTLPISRWVSGTSSYKSTGHSLITNAEFSGTTDLAPGGAANVYSQWGSTFDSGAVLAHATTPAPEFIGGGGGLPMDDVSVLTDVPGKICP